MRAEIEENEKLTRFIFHRDEVLVETDEKDAPISRFARGYDVIAGEITNTQLNEKQYYYYQLDEQFSTSFITNASGKVENRYTYDAFGNTLKSQENVHNRIKYTGQQYDPITQQYYLRARFYNTILGRFMQEDVYRGDGLNLYAYYENNPVMYYDPSGYERKNLEPRTRIENVTINPDGSKEYILKYKDKYQNTTNDRTFNITYTKDLDPMFKEHPEYIYNNGGKGSNVELTNGFNGRPRDFAEADVIIKNEYGIETRPEGYTWHHERDGKTMTLVKTDVHDSSTHTGGDSYTRSNKNSIQENNANSDTGKC